ncbi:Cyclin-like F-box [Ophiocordyceps camponoti-floridani]|uniref:Cyclin-like F-box n=1 Tax=Ophiocordyceps camponoti-floridani TaxID=2030778 RepID=A0A8H4Q8V3_9HYPO|nr:Cyclin-like F-box [Ophiocordyceps camponoti-floridani]
MAGLDPAAISLAPGAEPFVLVSAIQEIIRTRFCMPGCVFLVEGVDALPVTDTGRWQVIRLLLSDGELCIQALLDSALHRFVQTGEVAVGCYVRLQQFDLRWRGPAKDSDGSDDGRKLVYFVLRDLITVGWNETVTALHGRTRTALSQQDDSTSNKPDKESVMPQISAPHNFEPNHAETVIADIEDAFETLETIATPGEKLHTPQQPRARASRDKPMLPVAMAKDWHDPQTPLKLTVLRSIPHLPYAQNWSCNVLVIITSLSPVEPSHLPPHKQRKARIADPSTTKQVHLTVFLDPDEFTPRVGSAVLLTGVKNHRFDGGSLKKYASDGSHGIRWWFEDPFELAWCDVAGIKRWWADIEAAA